MSGAGAKVLRLNPEGAISTYASGSGLQDVIGVVGDENGNVYAVNWSSGDLYEITGGTVALLAQPGSSANQICYSNGHIYVPDPDGALINRVSLGIANTPYGHDLRCVRHPPSDSAN